MKIFIDSADIAEIQEAASMGVLDGVTTNPTLVAKTGRKYLTVLEDIAKIVDGPISAETVSLDCKGMMEEAKVFARIHPNITIKIAMGTEGLKAVKLCVEQGIKTNVTACMSTKQAVLAAKAGATYVSLFWARIEDMGYDAQQIAEDSVKVFDRGKFKSKIILGSFRQISHINRAILTGAHVLTIPTKILLDMAWNPRTESTIQEFLDSWAEFNKNK